MAEIARQFVAVLLCSLCLARGVLAADAPGAALDTAGESKPRLIVITDIGTEPDDMESMVRLLTYANEIDLEALIPSTSRHLPNRVYPFLIEERIGAYGEVLSNLRVHDPAYPGADLLLEKIAPHLPVPGMAGVGGGKDSDASRRIIQVVDNGDPRPVWVSIWGGAAPLAQALWTVRATRSPQEVEAFVARLRVYSISDQDDSGPWARANFPQLFWIASIHGPTQYELSTWTGISAETPGADPAPVSLRWLNENIRTHGPLGAAYPAPIFIMEGDTPSFLNLVANGLGSPEHPDWGGWGGRYERLAPSVGLWTDTQDSVKGIDGTMVRNHKATVWRWRQAFQNDFAARMDWSVSPRFEDANHAPGLVLNGKPGTDPVRITVCPGESVKLSAAGSRDPDGDGIDYTWWIYREVSGLWSPDSRLSQGEGNETVLTVPVFTSPAGLALADTIDVHVILEATDRGSPALTRYRRAIVAVPTAGQGCKPVAPGPSGPEPTPGSTISSVIEPLSANGWSTGETRLADMIANSAARAILDKYLPGLSAQIEANPQGGMLTLGTIKAMDPRLTDSVLQQIDQELTALPPR